MLYLDPSSIESGDAVSLKWPELQNIGNIKVIGKIDAKPGDQLLLIGVIFQNQPGPVIGHRWSNQEARPGVGYNGSCSQQLAK